MAGGAEPDRAGGRPRWLTAVVLVALVLASSGAGVQRLVEDPIAPASVDPLHKAADVAAAHAASEAGKVTPDVLQPFRGLSTWIDTYDTELTADQPVGIAAAEGVDTLFVQTARESTEGLVHDPARIARTIELAHDHGMQVVLWTIPDFEDLDRDRARAIAAIEFTTPRGDRADAFGLDIEVEDVAFHMARTRRLLQLSEELRAHAGWGYPMAAIVLPPLQLEINPRWWRDFPYAELAATYDVTVPMSYSSYRGSDAAITLQWNRDNVTRVRELIGDPDHPVHLAGGIANALPEVESFVRAVQESGAIGGGLYDLHTTPPEAWAPLRALAR